MRRHFVFLLFLFALGFNLFAQQTSVFGDIGNGYFRNPVIPSDYSDPDVIRVGDDYYGIASTSGQGPLGPPPPLSGPVVLRLLFPLDLV